ncbi:hypothetical protein KEM55_001446 [Ascosphaera atra]|nr:hypothetical protein KEM55_001446 [Ascosphaera atra]
MNSSESSAESNTAIVAALNTIKDEVNAMREDVVGSIKSIGQEAKSASADVVDHADEPAQQLEDEQQQAATSGDTTPHLANTSQAWKPNNTIPVTFNSLVSTPYAATPLAEKSKAKRLESQRK